MTEKRKQGMLVFLPMLVCFIGVLSISAFWMQKYRQAEFEHISKFCEILTENNPEAEPRVFLAVKEYCRLTEQERKGSRILTGYGYRSSEFYYGVPWRFLIPSAVLFCVAAGGFFLSMWYGNRRNQNRIAELTKYLEQVNIAADGMIIQAKEDAFSSLQDEIYKTVTSLYQTREAAVAAKNNFADNLANIAHQMKTPITAAFLSLQLGKEALCSSERTEGEDPQMASGNSREVSCFYWEQVKRQLDRLDRLEESLLILSKIDAGALQLESAQVDIYTVLTLAVENLNDLLRKKDISVDIPEHGCMEFCGDMEWSMEALMNLIKNCMDHSSPGGTIHCEYSVNPLYAEILIWDDGAGFRAEDIPYLFERFYRGKGAAGNGMGIGLSIARSVFEMQNGSITARNLPEGGACFEIRIYGSSH